MGNGCPMTRRFVLETFAETGTIEIDGVRVTERVRRTLPDAPTPAEDVRTFELRAGHVDAYIAGILTPHGWREVDAEAGR